MPYLAIILIVFAFLKEFYYGVFEIKEKKNKPGGIAVCFLAILGLIFPVCVIVIEYLI